MTPTRTLRELAEYLGGKVIGDETVAVNGLAPLENAGPDKITFLANPKYAAKVATTGAGGVLMAPGGERYGRSVIELANPYLGFAKLLTLFYTAPRPDLGVSPQACVAADARLGEGVSVYPGASIGSGVVIGSRCVVHPGAVIYAGVTIGNDTVIHANAVIRERCRIGSRCIIQPGAVIGSDGFGYAPDGTGYYRIPQIGIVVLEDDVEIGANTTIDRAALETTLVRRGTKLDNLVQVAHNCQIGEDCMIVSQVGISGSAKIGNHVTLGGPTPADSPMWWLCALPLLLLLLPLVGTQLAALSNGQLAAMIYPSGKRLDYTRDGMGRIQSIQLTPPVRGSPFAASHLRTFPAPAL